MITNLPLIRHIITYFQSHINQSNCSSLIFYFKKNIFTGYSNSLPPFRFYNTSLFIYNNCALVNEYRFYNIVYKYLSVITTASQNSHHFHLQRTPTHKQKSIRASYDPNRFFTLRFIFYYDLFCV